MKLIDYKDLKVNDYFIFYQAHTAGNEGFKLFGVLQCLDHCFDGMGYVRVDTIEMWMHSTNTRWHNIDWGESISIQSEGTEMLVFTLTDSEIINHILMETI